MTPLDFLPSFACRHRAFVTLNNLEPHRLIRMLDGASYVVSLDSSGTPDERGRYSILAADPMFVFSNRRDQAFVGPPDKLEPVDGPPLEVLKELLAMVRVPADVSELTSPPPFTAGFLGYIGYEVLYQIEDIPDLGRDDFPTPDTVLGFYPAAIVHDAFLRRTLLVVNGYGATPEEARTACDSLAQDWVQRIETAPLTHIDGDDLRRRVAEIRSRHPRLSLDQLLEQGVRPVCTRSEYLGIVQRAKDHIAAGDIFEICTCQRFDMTHEATGVEMYQCLREVSGAPYSAYLRTPEVEVVSSSPERFLSVDWQRWVETRPIKGTRPRGATPEEDAAYRHDLSTNKKDRAELVMITDLARNDLGRVCEFGTIEVLEEATIEEYPFTFQRVSTIAGLIAEERDAVDLLRAAFPGGSMTGAPKVEAMKIIDDLEPVKRGVFSGTIGYIDSEGALDLNIVIRTIVKKGTQLTFHVGGAIVTDSDPEEEYQETLDKAYGMVLALQMCAPEGAAP